MRLEWKFAMDARFGNRKVRLRLRGWVSPREALRGVLRVIDVVQLVQWLAGLIG